MDKEDQERREDVLTEFKRMVESHGWVIFHMQDSIPPHSEDITVSVDTPDHDLRVLFRMTTEFLTDQDVNYKGIMKKGFDLAAAYFAQELSVQLIGLYSDG